MKALPNIPRVNVTYGNVDKVLRSLGFSCRTIQGDTKGLCYEHKETGAYILLPDFPKKDRVFDYHFAMVRGTLDDFGIAEPSVFDAKLKKTG